VNYYRHHIGDYLRDTAHLSMLEDAAYRRMLDLYYMREQPLPAESKAVCRLVRARSPEECEAVETVLAEFFTLARSGPTLKSRICAQRQSAREPTGKSGGVRGKPGRLFTKTQKKPSRLFLG